MGEKTRHFCHLNPQYRSLFRYSTNFLIVFYRDRDEGCGNGSLSTGGDKASALAIVLHSWAALSICDSTKFVPGFVNNCEFSAHLVNSVYARRRLRLASYAAVKKLFPAFSFWLKLSIRYNCIYRSRFSVISLFCSADSEKIREGAQEGLLRRFMEMSRVFAFSVLRSHARKLPV